MSDRRLYIFYLLACVPLLTVCLPVAVCAAPPQFNIAVPITSYAFSPFPDDDPRFVSSLTPSMYVPLMNLYRQKPYEVTVNFPEYSITYARRIKGDQLMVPVTSDFDAFVNRRLEISMRGMSSDIGRQSLVRDQKSKAGGLVSITIPIRSKMFESIFGEGGAGLKISGYRKISFTGRSTWNESPETALHRQSKFPTLQMEQVYSFEIEGTIGSKITVKVNQDSRNDLPLANKLILRYRGAEDDVLQTVEAGNTTLNLPATSFLAYSSRVQGLFGIKATAQIADVSITAIASQEKGSTESVEISAGSSSAASSVVRDVENKERAIFDLGILPMKRAISDTIQDPGWVPGDYSYYDFLPGDSIIKVLLYNDDNTNDITEQSMRPEARMYIRPGDTMFLDTTSEYKTTARIEPIEEVDYYFSPKNFYIQFLRSGVIGSDDILGAYIEVKRANGHIDTLGNISTTPYKLKLIKPTQYFEVNHHVWEYQWRNVYWLGASNIDPNYVEVKIYKGKPVNNTVVNPEDLTHQNGIEYLQIFGLDQGDNYGNGAPDNMVDRTQYIDGLLGYLIFPDRHPFDADTFFVKEGADSIPVVPLEAVPELYTKANTQQQSQSSKYYIAVMSQGRGSSVIDLKATNIIEGSEVVKDGETRLVRGEDYNIDYNFGRLTLLKDEYTDINSNLSVMYENAPFFSLAKKTLLGTRLEYAPNKEFKLGTTLLFKSDKSTNRKPKVGEETSKMFVWDADFSYRLDFPLFTTLTNALPFVSASAQSYLQLSGELAQSYPNPNVDGEVYIDDFEGAKDSYSLGIFRTNWQHCSRPAVIDTAVSERAHVAWYNPLSMVPITEIWNRDLGTGETNSTHVLNVVFKPVDHKFLKDSVNNVIDSASAPIEPEKSWAGFMKHIPLGGATQLEYSQLLEMRLKGKKGIMHIDLGRMSEDINGNGRLDDEDKDGLRILEDDEDVGLDGLPDSLEFGYDPENGVNDPVGDDFDADNIWRINGTEGNRVDPDNGWKPDTEDPDYDNLELVNDYFSYRVDLNDTLNDYSFYVDGTQNDSGWKTIRIPLREPDAIDTIVGNPEWNKIWYARIWFDSVGMDQIINPVTIQIASIEMLSTTWIDSFVVADSLRSGDASFEVAVINDEVDARYTPPPGVEGYYDQSREALESEQSLLLRFEDLNAAIDVFSPDSGIVLAADTGLAVRRFFRAMNFMGYGRLQAYVYSNLRNEASDSVLFFFRLGYDKDSYYEYRTYLKPGWDPSNYVNINFEEMTGVKARLMDARDRGVDSSLYRREGSYAVKMKSFGQDPTLTRIQYFSMGVINLDPDKKASGEVWIDELRLTDVRDDVGTAARFAINGNMSDLGNYSFSYSTQDAYYRGVSSATKGGAANNLGSGQTKKNYSFSGSVNLDKFFPRSLELDLPLRVNYTESVSEPLLKSGTDIVVPKEMVGGETSVSVTRGFRISEKISKKTNNPFFTLLLNRFSSNFTYSKTTSHSPTQPLYLRENYSSNASFDMSLTKPPSIQPFTWMRWLRVVPFGVPDMRFYLYPQRLNFTGDLTGTYQRSVNQNNAAPVSSTLDFRGNMNTTFKVTENLSGSYSFSTRRDLRNPETVKFSLNPKEFKLGVEESYSQSSRLSYQPKLFNFLTHSFDYSATYSDNYQGGKDSVFIHNVSSKISGNASFTFKHQSLIGSNKSRGKNNRREVDSTSSIFDAFGFMLTGIHYITDAIDPISMKVSTGRSLTLPSLADKAGLPFRFGLTEDPGVSQLSSSSVNQRQAKSISKSLSGNSGVSLFAGISADLVYSRSTQENYGTSNPQKTINLGWPDVKFDLRSIKGLWYFGKLMNTLSPSSRYARNKDTKLHTTAPGPYEVNIKEAFAPLISFSINPTRSMRSSVRYEISASENTTYNEDTGEHNNIVKRSEKSFTFGWSYSFRNPNGIKLPIFGRLKFESNLSVSADVTYRKSHSEAATPKTNFEFKTTEDKTSLTVSPSANYGFSSTVKGGLSGRWIDSSDIFTRRKTHTREVQIWIELRF